jgi:hypothetical protein
MGIRAANPEAIHAHAFGSTFWPRHGFNGDM